MSERKPQTSLQKHLDSLSRINKDLASYLSDTIAPLARPTEPEGKPNFPLFFNRMREPDTETFHIISKGYSCSCRGLHVFERDMSNSSLQSKGQLSWGSEWAHDLLLPSNPTARIPVITTSPPQATGRDVESQLIKPINDNM
jgi:hypothetical protein